MKAIFKYQLDKLKTEILLPKYSKILSCINQRNKLVVYALVETTFPEANREVICIATGEELKIDENFEFLNTVTFFDGEEVYHVFIKKEQYI